jgi:hypothetical protein
MFAIVASWEKVTRESRENSMKAAHFDRRGPRCVWLQAWDRRSQVVKGGGAFIRRAEGRKPPVC